MRAPLRRQRGYVLVLVLLATFLVLAFAGVIQGLLILERQRDRVARLESEAQQIIASAQVWTRRNEVDFGPENTLTLPIDDLLASSTAGRVVLRGVSAGPAHLVECEVTVERAGQRLVRRAVWPLPPRR
ncbi:MAG: hypothetical protein AB1716_11085 [Planctomycetota bacterium]